MRLLVVAFFAVVSAVIALAKEPDPISVADGFRKAIGEAPKLMVSEGLPPVEYRSLMRNEWERKDVGKIADYFFYTPEVEMKDSKALKKLLGSAGTFRVLVENEPKLCGIFHPDYAASWKSGETTFHALICFGCAEVILTTAGKIYYYNLEKEACKRLKEQLAPYASKCPESMRS